MKIRFFSFSVLLVLMLVLLGCGPSRIPAVPRNGSGGSPAQLWVTPLSGKGGPTPLTIYGAGFIPGEKVKLILATEGLTIHMARPETGGSVMVNEFGAFVEKLSGFPMGIKEGVYTLRAEGDRGSAAVAPIEILK